MFMSNALIGLREGLEAGMVITVLLAFLAGRGRRREIRLVWAGVAAALLASAAVGLVLHLTTSMLDEWGEVLFGSAAALLAVMLITGMIFWMRHSMQEERDRLEQQASEALRVGPAAVLLIAFAAVFREGLEAAVFVLVLAGQGSASSSVAGLLAGVGTAAVVTWLLYAGMLRINMSRLLTATGLVLAVIAAGVLSHTVIELQHIGVLPGAHAVVFDLTPVLPPESWHGELLAGLFGVAGQPTAMALVCWVAYLGAVLFLFLRDVRRPVGRTIPAPQAIEEVGKASGGRR